MDNEERKQQLREKAKLYRLRYKLNGPTVHHTEKRCSRCDETKPIEAFALCRTNADWRATKCRKCATAAKDEWRKQFPERARSLSYQQYLRDRNKPDNQRLKHSRKYYQTHKGVQAQRNLAWRKKNKKHVNAYMLRYHKAKYERDPNYRFGVKIRTKIRLLMRGQRKSATTEQLLGCLIVDFKRYLELQWEPWMSWENYGNKVGGWVIDHIVPVYAFDLSKPEDQRCCFHFSNQRPLCVQKNQDKSCKFNPVDLDTLRRKVLCLSKSSSLHQQDSHRQKV